MGKGYTLIIKNHETGEYLSFDLDTMTFTEDRDLVEKIRSAGDFEHPGYASRGLRFELSGYKLNKNFENEYSGVNEDKGVGEVVENGKKESQPLNGCNCSDCKDREACCQLEKEGSFCEKMYHDLPRIAEGLSDRSKMTPRETLDLFTTEGLHREIDRRNEIEARREAIRELESEIAELEKE